MSQIIQNFNKDGRIGDRGIYSIIDCLPTKTLLVYTTDEDHSDFLESKGDISTRPSLEGFFETHVLTEIEKNYGRVCESKILFFQNQEKTQLRVFLDCYYNGETEFLIEGAEIIENFLNYLQV